MKYPPERVQPLALPHDACHQPDPVWIMRELERVALLVPEVSHSAARDQMQTYALAYVERYQGDVLQLEHEWEFLYAALLQAWQRGEYAVVVRLVTGLAHPAGRLSNSSVAEHVLQLGVEASRLVEDGEHLASFLNRLGCLLFVHGKYRQGWRTWCESLELAGTAGSSLCPWEPLCNFTHIADMLGDYVAAQQFVETLLHTLRIDNPDAFAVAVFIRGFYARVTNKLEGAHEDFSYCLRLLSLQTSGAPRSVYRQLFTLVVQAEMARLQGDYRRSQAYTETALSLAQIFADCYTVVDLLVDQALFTYQQGQFADMQAVLLRLYDVLSRSGIPQLYDRCRFLEQRLAERLPESCSVLSRYGDQQVSSTAYIGLQEPLSGRELEVLQLVAAGLSNQEIAERLVVTAATVKKHLEHIYTKLDVHSRTSAIARARALKVFH